MSITSYAQNFEDVILWRALGHIQNGRYIDIGAQDPIIDSVSLAFHEHGWRGIHVEPTPHYAELLRQQRPGDTVIQAAVGKGRAKLRFFEIPDTGISTADAIIAAQHREHGFDVHEITVPCIALSAVFTMCAGSDIHWLKIDVEGFEKQVLSSWGKSAARPWIVVVESTLPMTQIETHESWESILIGYGYSPVYFDGLNRYYISDAHPELKDAFLVPPNIFDGFTLNGTASAPFHHLIDARYKEKISEILAQNEQQKQSATNEIERLTLSLAALDKTHAEQEQKRAQREQEVAAQLLAIQQQAAHEKAEQASSHSEQAHALQREHAEREQTLAQQLQAGQQELRRLEQDRAKREQVLSEQTSLARQELEALLRTQVQREQEVAAQLLAIQQQAEQEKAEQARSHSEQERALQRQHTEREQTIAQQLQAAQQELRRLEQEWAQREKAHAEQTSQIRQELEAVLRTQAQREQEVAAQLLAIQQQADAEKTELSQQHQAHVQDIQRQQAEHEWLTAESIHTLNQELHRLQADHAASEQRHADNAAALQTELATLLRTQAQREQAVAAQLLAIQQQAAQEKAEQAKSHSEQARALQRQHAEREQTLAQHLQAGQQELRLLEQDRAQREKEHAEQTSRTRQELENLLRTQAQREQEIAAQLLAIQQQAEQEQAEQARQHSEQELALQREHAEREQALAQQLQAGQQELHRLAQERILREQEIAAQLLAIQQQAHQEKAEQAKSHSEQGRALQRQINTLQHELATMRNGLSWRLTAPLRTVASWFKPTSTQTGHAISAAEHPVVAPISHPEPDTAFPSTQEFTSNSPFSETTSMTSDHSTQATQPTPSSTAQNLKALLQYQDYQFVECAYLTLLKRQPDPEGLNYYLGRLHACVPKIQILSQVMGSPEAQMSGIKLPGLHEAIRRHKLSRLPLFGRLFKVVSRLVNSEYQTLYEPDEGTLERAKIQRQPGLIQNSITRLRSESGQLPTTQNRETEIDRVTQETIDVKVTATAEMEGRLRLSADRSIDEPAWLRYLGQVINLRLIVPLCIAGTPPPPSAALVVIIDCTEGIGTAEERTRTRNCLSLLLAASEYPVKPFWYVHSDELKQPIEKENSIDTLSQVVSTREIGKCICDEDVVLVLKPGDEVRPEIHMALKYFGSFDAELTLIDMYFRGNGRVYPVLLHAVDPIHASHCDYFFGRYAANGKQVKKYLDHSSSATPSLIGAAICSQLRVEDCRSHRHIAIPLLCIQTSNAELATLREAIILERPPSTCAPILISSPHDLKTVGKSPSITRQAPVVSVIICTKDCGLLLRQLLYRLEREPLIRDIVIVSNNTTNVHAISTLAAVSMLERVTVLGYDRSFSFSNQCNLGAKHAKGDVLLFLNDDMAPISDDWLQRLLDWMDSPRIVGPLLIYPNESVQHAGMHLGFNGVAGHVMRHSRLPSGDYGFFLTAPRRVSCLSGAALMMPKELFNSLNGFDPMLADSLQDVDLSLRALHSGYELVFNPYSIIMHMESVSVIPTLNNTKVRRTRELEYAYFYNRWGIALRHDAWMNPLFDSSDESLTTLRS